ncbi:MAG: hypothetical protein EXS08_09180 [Planctomycetes bacterium]|nr:hypothetical protein [Planctomycetota bacterium]
MAVGYARFAAVSLGLLLASTAATGIALILPPNPLSALLLIAKEQVLPGVESRLAEQSPVRNAKVRAELARLGEHPWAGVYRTAGIWPTELVLAPEEGFTLYRGSGCGNCARFVALGSVLAVESSTLKLGVELAEPDDTSGAWFGLDDTLHLVRWGELAFAVPASRLELFCAEASDGVTFPYVPFRTVGIPGDLEHPLRPPGKPTVPREFEHLLLDEPIAGSITALAAWRRRAELDGKELQAFDALFALDVGADDGLVVGMHLFVPGAWRPDRFSGRVEAVEPRSARLQLLVFEDRREWARGLVGERVSTHAPEPKPR